MSGLFWSFTHRPYVTLFLLAFLALSWMEQGRLRTLIWMVSGYMVAFAAEWTSINHGIPFGFYVYNYDALSNDLVIAGVPFFDSLSFAFLSYVSFSFAQFFLSPLWVRGLDVQRVTPRKVRNSAAALFLGACLMVVIDLIVDPVTHHGKHWFLGDIYYYPVPGNHFDVPLANYAGWFVVGWVTILINQHVDRWLAAREAARGRQVTLRYAPAKGLFAPLFWAGILLFQLGVTAWLGWGYDLADVAGDRQAWQKGLRTQFLAGCFVVAPILILAAMQLVRTNREPEAALIEEWLQEYPCPPLQAQRTDKS
ncbi:MAG: carotenoid biosynthesis protein [Planctomycetes bacterium]|nr:carotenoid biosynthesis protein [Planctomycetota bacterium]